MPVQPPPQQPQNFLPPMPRNPGPIIGVQQQPQPQAPGMQPYPIKQTIMPNGSIIDSIIPDQPQLGGPIGGQQSHFQNIDMNNPGPILEDPALRQQQPQQQRAIWTGECLVGILDRSLWVEQIVASKRVGVKWVI